MEPVSGMSAIITAITSMVTGAIGWMTSYLGAITASGNEVLLFFVLFGFIGTGVGLIKRLTTL